MITKDAGKYYTLIVLTIPITYQYKSFIPGVNFAEFLLLLFSVYFIFLGKVRLQNISLMKSNPMWWMIFGILFTTLISLTMQYDFSTFDIISRYLRIVFYLLCVLVLSFEYFDWDFFIKGYISISIFITGYLVIQTLLYVSFGIYLPGVVSGLGISNELYDFERSKAMFADFYRPSSIFLESGYYAQYTLPLLVYALFNSKPRLALGLFISLGLLLSTSGQAMIIGAVVWFMWVVFKTIDIKNKEISVYNLGILLALLPFIPFLMKNETVITSWNRLWGSPNASSNLRISYGFEVFKELSLFNKVFGVGYGNSENFILINGLGMNEKIIGYMNSFAYLLVNTGFIGFLFVIFIFFYIFFQNKLKMARVTLLAFFLLCAVSSIFISVKMIFYVSIILYMSNSTFEKGHFKNQKEVLS